ncbi:hypothetical protein [Bhargavaea beijingensis]|uniref:Uncharacterized protein n=1 Tax=Bhargavaea beijingensis TaxID=426756 RepID=A0A1G7B1I0_9BACL|nr:hypothetical protein [Bhargavaea beijingensis]RSK29679.1 hypothetical protein EJA12_11370 [Bhargavaea beijingensis]SDE20871.1 hypothetical protein SAMN04488126_1055 [Bhargavaea beijingensis]
MTTWPKTCSHCANIWCLLAGVLAGAVLLALFWAVPALLRLPAIAGIWEILLIIVVILVVLLALGILLKALFCLFRTLRGLT